uniref:Multiple epidermal growth factor-like domains 6 n=1 Tax=Magallana gigas TaxID=29159 RepID=K1QIS0_MAGGI
MSIIIALTETCPPGTYGDNCSTACPNQHYGENCGLKCNCRPDEECHTLHGCRSITTTPISQTTTKSYLDKEKTSLSTTEMSDPSLRSSVPANIENITKGNTRSTPKVSILSTTGTGPTLGGGDSIYDLQVDILHGDTLESRRRSWRQTKGLQKRKTYSVDVDIVIYRTIYMNLICQHAGTYMYVGSRGMQWGLLTIITMNPKPKRVWERHTFPSA